MTQPQPSPEELRHQLATLEEQAAALRQQLSGSGVQVGRDQTVQGDLVIGDKIGTRVNTDGGPYIAGSISVAISPEAPPADLLAAYYRCVAAECSHLPLGVIDKEFVRASGGSAAQAEQAIPLPDIYVDLDVVAPAQERGRERPCVGAAIGARRGQRAHALAGCAGANVPRPAPCSWATPARARPPL